MREFFTNLLAMFNLQPAAKPPLARACEFCGGVKCIGACGLIGDSGRPREFCGRLVPGEGNEGCFACDDGTLLRFQRDSKAGQKILSDCPADQGRYRITVTVDEGVITALLSAARREPAE